jgi:hydrogenase-4 component B
VSPAGVGIAALLLGGAAPTALGSRPALGRRLFQVLGIAGCLSGLVPAIPWLLDAKRSAGPGPSPWFGLDPLSAWFLVLILGVGAVTIAYGARYWGAEDGPRARRAHGLLAVLLVALAGVVTATTVLAFLVAWEVMAVTGFFLIIYDHHDPGVRRAGTIYLALTHASTLALMLMFAAWTGGHLGASFADLATSPPRPAALVLLLAGLGFGIKAGVVPFHFWLPGAHAAAPSHVSALLSGVVIKAGIYGLFRVLSLVAPIPAWWGWTALVIGVASAILGVLWALAQHDLKRLLAYHSVENIGIIGIGLGLGALGGAYGHPIVSTLGYTGALLHTLNHAVYKSLLFLGAGSVAQATGTREIDRLGGLARILPRTAIAFGVAAAAIVGLPPLNGFVSEWVIFQGLLQAGVVREPLRVAAAATAGLALTGGLALACFAKLYGTVFLGTSRSPATPARGGVDAALGAPQLVLAAACFLLGVAPVAVVPIAARIAARLGPGHEGVGGVPGLGPAAGLVSLAAVGLIAVVLAIVGLMAWIGARRPHAREGRTWACGFPRPSSRAQYTAASFAAPILGAFGPLVPGRVERGDAVFHVRPRDPVLDVFGTPLWRRLRSAGARANLLQKGRIRLYLVYVIVTLLALLFYLRPLRVG